MTTYKFDKEKYITKGINETLPAEITIYLWTLIEDLKKEGISLDYLQVFELSQESKDTLQVVHSQEIPPYKKVYKIKIKESIKENTKENTKEKISTRVFVIDDTTHATMLIDYEY